jgi:AraC family transcriptional activator of tynA and feaB
VAFHEGMSVCAVELPVPWMREHLSLPDERRSAVIPRDAGWGRVLSALALELSKDLTLATQLPAPQLLDHLGGLLRGALEPDEPGGSRRSVLSLQDRAERVLAQRLAEPGLSAGDVAQALGVSVRTLHRVFAGSGSTFAATLRERRLQHAVSLLRRHNLGGVPVAEIGALCGFQDASHFSREFHRQWGAPPARWRLLQAN